MTCGIYAIQNDINGKIYVGQSRDIEDRWKGHKNSLNKGEGINRHLQNSWDKYGEDNFTFSVLCECATSKLNEMEQYYIYCLDTRNPKVGYNKNNGGDGIGCNDDVRMILSEKSRLAWENEEYRENMSSKLKLLWEQGCYDHITKRKPLIQCTLDGRIVRTWEAKNYCCNQLFNGDAGNFYRVLRNGGKYKNYLFYEPEEYFIRYGMVNNYIKDSDYNLERVRHEEYRRRLKELNLQINGENHKYDKIAKEVHSYVSTKCNKGNLICLNTKDMFSSKEEAEYTYGINLKYMNKNFSFNGVYKGEPLVWITLGEFITMSDSDIHSLINKAKDNMNYYHGSIPKAIICVELDKVFISIHYASRKLGICQSSVSRALKCGYAVKGYHFIRYGGGRPDFDEILRIQQKELKESMRTNCSK